MTALKQPRIDTRPGTSTSSGAAFDDEHKVSAYTHSAADPGNCLGAPPRDVERMLRRHDAKLPRYLDVKRLRDIAQSHQRWPLLGKPSGERS